MLLIAAASALAAPTVDAGLGVGLFAWQRSASHAALPSAGLFTTIRSDAVGATVEVGASSSAEQNSVLSVSTTQIRAYATFDASIRRTGAALSFGTGPGLALDRARVSDDDEAWAGASPSFAWRVRLSGDGRLAGPLGWRAALGAALRRGGTDVDAGVGLTVRLGGPR